MWPKINYESNWNLVRFFLTFGYIYMCVCVCVCMYKNYIGSPQSLSNECFWLPEVPIEHYESPKFRKWALLILLLTAVSLFVFMANRIVTWWFISAVEQVLILTSFDKLERQTHEWNQIKPSLPQIKNQTHLGPMPSTPSSRSSPIWTSDKFSAKVRDTPPPWGCMGTC